MRKDFFSGLVKTPDCPSNRDADETANITVDEIPVVKIGANNTVLRLSLKAIVISNEHVRIIVNTTVK